MAALDALLYQCPDEGWKAKILSGKLDFQESLDWGIRTLTAKEEGKELGVAGSETTNDIPVDRVEEKKLIDCGRCFEKHEIRNCPAWGSYCSGCGTKNHMKGS